MLAEIIWTQQIVGIVMGCSIPIAAFWYKIEHVRSHNDLKRTMIERGMSADEIERILDMPVGGKK